MKKHVAPMSFLIFSLGLAGCAGKPSSEWDPQASASLKAEFEKMLKDIDAGNFDAMTAKVAKDAIVFDLDEKNSPTRMDGSDQIRKYFSGFEQMMKTQGLKIKSTAVKTDCHATQMMGFCAGEFDQVMTVGGQSMGAMKFRGTLVARKVGEAWQWTHWHGSFREAPPMPSEAQAQAPAGAGGAGQPQAAPPKEGGAAPAGEGAK